MTGSFNEMRFFNQVPESFEDNLAHIDDLGGPSSYNHYAWGWAWAGDTPFRRWKRETYRGGSTDPFILAWPAGMAARGEVRTQYAHVDRHGADRARRARHRSRRRRSAACRRRRWRASASRTRSTTPQAPSKHVTQYFEMFGHRAIYHDGWRAVCPWPAPNFTDRGQARAQARRPDHARGPGGARPQRLGALPTWPTTRPSRTTSPPSTRTSCATWSRAGGRRRRSTRCSRSTASVQARLATERPQTSKPRDPLRLLPGRLGRARVRGAAGLQPRRTRSRPTSTSPPAAPRACCWPRAATPAATPST